MSAPRRAWLRAGALGLLVIALDQASKALIEANLVPGEHVAFVGPLELTLSHNSGVAFGIASGGGVALVALTLVALGFVGVLFARNPGRPGMWIAVGLLVGGALGNLIDRVRADAVTDFVDVLSWPPFNLADMAITLGVIALALSYTSEAERE